MKTYIETLDYLYSQLPMFQRVGKSAYKEDIGNIIKLSKAIGNPHKSFKSIHIGGTNGKGSVSNILSSVFMEAGYKVGTYTSPHYVDFRERIKINGEYISQNDVVDFVEKIDPFLSEIQPSFFEITVAMAFDFFAKENVDIAMIEVGLGGRLDSTNIINPELSIITNISFDHQAILGNTIEKIAEEKAGIIKAKTPVVIGKTQAKTKPIFIKKAQEKEADIYFADKNCDIKKNRDLSLTLHSGDNDFSLSTKLNNSYQLENITTAYVAFTVLKDKWNINQENFAKGIENINHNSPLIGRWQIIQERPLVVLDSCHNEAGIDSFITEIEQINKGQLHLVYGAVSDKDVAKIINLFPKNAQYYLTEPSVIRKMPVETLATFFTDFESVSTYTKPKLALKEAITHAKPNDVVAAFGSIFLIADILQKA